MNLEKTLAAIEANFPPEKRKTIGRYAKTMAGARDQSLDLLSLARNIPLTWNEERALERVNEVFLEEVRGGAK